MLGSPFPSEIERCDSSALDHALEAVTAALVRWDRNDAPMSAHAISDLTLHDDHSVCVRKTSLFFEFFESHVSQAYHNRLAHLRTSSSSVFLAVRHIRSAPGRQVRGAPLFRMVRRSCP